MRDSTLEDMSLDPLPPANPESYTLGDLAAACRRFALALELEGRETDGRKRAHEAVAAFLELGKVAGYFYGGA